MKQTPQETKIQERLEPGIITLEGFIGNDTRHYHEIIREDLAVLEELEITSAEIAERMSYFTEKAFLSYDESITIDDKYLVEYNTIRGRIICPFPHPGTFPKGEIVFKNLKNGIVLRWTPLNIHMIEAHNFFEGKGSPHRLEPITLKKALFDN